MSTDIFRISLLTILICFFTLGHSFAQELNFTVTVQAFQLQITDPQVLETLEREVEDFINTTRWTEDDYETEERIEGNLLITITAENGANNFVADFTVQSIRTAFNSSYKSKLINYKDDGYAFSYQENQPIVNSSERYFDNLSTILTFYSYVVLGFDYDSYSKFGGDRYFDVANYIVQSLPSNLITSGGWAKTSNRISRWWLIENVNNPKMRSFREAQYVYHRKGLDLMSDDAGKGKAIILSSLKSIAKANDGYPNSMLVRMFGDSKNAEIVEIFQIGDRAEKLVVYDLMVNIDPFRTGVYNTLKR